MAVAGTACEFAFLDFPTSRQGRVLEPDGVIVLFHNTVHQISNLLSGCRQLVVEIGHFTRVLVQLLLILTQDSLLGHRDFSGFSGIFKSPEQQTNGHARKQQDRHGPPLGPQGRTLCRRTADLFGIFDLARQLFVSGIDLLDIHFSGFGQLADADESELLAHRRRVGRVGRFNQLRMLIAWIELHEFIHRLPQLADGLLNLFALFFAQFALGNCLPFQGIQLTDLVRDFNRKRCFSILLLGLPTQKQNRNNRSDQDRWNQDQPEDRQYSSHSAPANTGISMEFNPKKHSILLRCAFRRRHRSTPPRRKNRQL